MKSELFKTAWKLVKQTKISFSQALKKSWKAFKANAKVIINKSWNGIITVAYRIELGKCAVMGRSIEVVLDMASRHKPINNDYAIAYYGVGRYNGD